MLSNRFGSCLLGCLTVALLFISGSALALSPSDPTPTTSTATKPKPSTRSQKVAGKLALGRLHFKKGVELYRLGASDAALAEFDRAYQVAPHFRILYNLAQVQAQRQRYVEALTYFQRYLHEATSPISAKRRASVRAAQLELKALVSELRFVPPQRVRRTHSDEKAQRATIREAKLYVDGVLRGTISLSKSLLLNAGVHQVRLEVKGYRSHVRTITLVGGENTAMRLLLQPIEPRAVAQLKPAKSVVLLPWSANGLESKTGGDRVNANNEAGRDTTAVWLLGTTGLLVGATAALGLATHRTQQDLNRELALYPANRAHIEDKRNNLRLFAQATDMVGVFAVVSAGLATYLFVSSETTPPAKPSIALQAQPTSTGLSLLCSGHF